MPELKEEEWETIEPKEELILVYDDYTDGVRQRVAVEVQHVPHILDIQPFPPYRNHV